MMENNENNRYIKYLAIFSLPLVLLISGVVYFYFQLIEESYSFLAGGLLGIFNILILAYVLKSLLSQKSVAWAVILIVSKYPFLGFIIYILATRAWFDVIFFCAGFGLTILVAIGLFYLKKETNIKEGKTDGSL